MTNTPKENTYIEPSLESKKEQDKPKTSREMWDAFSKIKEYYEKNPNSIEAKKLTIKQIKELTAIFTEYKNALIEKKVMQGSNKDSMSRDLDVLEEQLKDTQTLLEGTDKNAILSVIYKNVEIIRGRGTNITKKANNFLLTYLPKEYLNNGNIKSDMLGESESQKTRDNIKAFIDGNISFMPAIGNDDFEKFPDEIEKALSKPGAIFDMYQRLYIYEDNTTKLKQLTDNPRFIVLIDKLLVKEHQFFRQIEGKEWYNKDKSKLTFEKIVTILDIIRYRPPERQKDFLDMMDGAGKGEVQKSMNIYDEYFAGTEIGGQIQRYFQESKFTLVRKSKIEETIDANGKKQKNPQDGFYDTFNKDVIAKKGLKRDLFDIPPKILNSFLSHITEIETLCKSESPKKINQIIDPLNTIDVVFKRNFFYGLMQSLPCTSAEDINVKSASYYKIINFYWDQNDIKAEKANIEKQKVGEQFSIIATLFPGEENKELRDKKNQEFKELLRDDRFFDGATGALIVSKDSLILRLENIFKVKGTEKSNLFFEKIKKSKTGKEIFEVLSHGFAEEKIHIEKSLGAGGFKYKEWNEFASSNIQESKIILEKINSLGTNTEEILKLLANFINPEKIPKGEQERKEFIEKIAKELQNHASISRKAQIYTPSKENLADFAESWKTGNFETFNQKTQEREEKREQAEIKKQELQKEQEQGNKVLSAASLDFQAFNTAFNKISNDKIVKTFVDGQEVYIKKDSNNEVSIFSSGVPIRGIKITDIKNPQEDINKALDSVQFIRSCGLSIFGNSLPKMIDIINNKQKGKGEKHINLADGLNAGGEEERILLQYIAKMIDIDAALSIDNLRKEFNNISKNEGMLSRLRAKKPEYVTNNSLNMTTILNDLEKAGG